MCCIVVYCNAMHGGAAWRGAAGGLGVVRCGVDCVVSARQAFLSASAFNQNIGGWTTAAVTTMSQACALVPSPACGAQPKSLLAAVVPAASGPWQMWEWPTSDVGESRRRCGRVPAQMWECRGRVVSRRRCGTGSAQL
jgi:hypothetical protein